MRSIPTWFFATGAVFALAGMVGGIQMSASHDHTLSPAHGHLNLIGFVMSAVFGTYYALTPRAAASGLAKLHFGLLALSVVVLVPGIVFAIRDNWPVLAQIGSLLSIATMALFLFVVLRYRVGPIADTTA